MSRRLEYLYDRFRQKLCSYDELNEFLALLQNDEGRQIAEKLADRDWQLSGNVAEETSEVDWDFMFHSILKKAVSPVVPVRDAKPTRSKIFSFGRLSAAAVILVVIGTFFYLTLFRDLRKNETAKNKSLQNIQKDIAPGGDKAVLTLADGTKVVLDTANNGALTQQGRVTVTKLGGQLIYKPGEAANNEVLYNTITTPRGGQYQLVLADGTKVWLNAQSSLRYPTSFVGTERRVEITGEAYFEVAKSKGMPFKVNVSGRGTVEVLGTHFNINAYSDEPVISTTLLEGSVRFTVAQNNSATTIFPGQQIQVRDDGTVKLNKDVDVESVVGWKNGTFHFVRQDIPGIMRQISRWYDVEVEYTGPVSHETFTGVISRYSNVSEVLGMMESEGVNFKIEGKKILVRF